MPTTITGEHTTAEVFLDEADLEGLTRNQIQEMVDHEAFTGLACGYATDSPVREIERARP